MNLEYDLRYISAEQVESIEVMKGAASTLYGSGAAAGVINITLKKASKKQIEGNAYVNLGTQTTADNTNYRPQDFNQGFGLNGTIGKINYLATLNSVETKGISEAKGVDFEEDHFSKITTLLNEKVQRCCCQSKKFKGKEVHHHPNCRDLKSLQ